MSDDKTLVYILGAAVVLLAVIAGVLIFRGSPTAAPVDTTGTQTQPPATMNPAPSASIAPFDPKTATKVVGDPKNHVNKYFDAIMKGDFATAYKLLPTDKKVSYGTEAAFATQLKSYAAKSYSPPVASVSGDTETVTATLQTPQMSFTYVWTFVKYKGAWVVRGRAIGNMGQ
jgi:hypothetical protein